LVRNEKWSAESDPVRKANPDRIRITTGQEPGVIAATVLADDDTAKASVSLTPAPIALQQQVSSVEALRDRSLALPTGVIDYLAPNVTSPVLQSREARTALELSTPPVGVCRGAGQPDRRHSHGLAHSRRPARPGDHGGAGR
jgi:peptide/nickel transport system substrate-binding protein